MERRGRVISTTSKMMQKSSKEAESSNIVRLEIYLVQLPKRFSEENLYYLQRNCAAWMVKCPPQDMSFDTNNQLVCIQAMKIDVKADCAKMFEAWIKDRQIRSQIEEHVSLYKLNVVRESIAFQSRLLHLWLIHMELVEGNFETFDHCIKLVRKKWTEQVEFFALVREHPFEGFARWMVQQRKELKAGNKLTAEQLSGFKNVHRAIASNWVDFRRKHAHLVEENPYNREYQELVHKLSSNFGIAKIYREEMIKSPSKKEEEVSSQAKDDQNAELDKQMQEWLELNETLKIGTPLDKDCDDVTWLYAAICHYERRCESKLLILLDNLAQTAEPFGTPRSLN